MGNACANLELFDEAIEAFKNSLIVDNNFSEAYFSIGSIYVLMNDKAIEYFNKAEDESQALRNIGRAINLSPLDGEPGLLKAKIYLAFDRYEQALETLDEMERMLPDAFDV